MTTLAFSPPAVDVLEDENIRTALTQGDCWLLAYEMFAQSFYPMAVNVCSDDHDLWNHMGVFLPDGTVLDIDGVSTVAQWQEKYPCNCGGTGCRQTAVIEVEDANMWKHYVNMLELDEGDAEFCYFDDAEENWLVNDEYSEPHHVYDVASALLGSVGAWD